MSFRNIKIASVLVSAIVAASFGATTVFAHATPVSYSPDISKALTKVPDEVSIKFSERIESGASRMTVIGPTGGQAGSGSSSVVGSDNHNLRISLRDDGEGLYTVSWYVVSADDGHYTNGAFSFAVGSRAAPPLPATFTTNHDAHFPEAVSIFIELMGQSLLVGALAIAWFIVRPIGKRRELFEGMLKRRFSIAILLGVLLVFVGGACFIVLQAKNIAPSVSGGFGSALTSVISTTSVTYTFIRIGLAFLFAIIWFIGPRVWQKKARIKDILLFLVLLSIMVARARVSHAAASSFFPILSVAINAIHLLFKELWIGGIVVTLLVFSAVTKQILDRRIVVAVLAGFGMLSVVALAVGGVTGAYIVWLHLKSFGFIGISDWGRGFLALSIGAALLLGLRLFTMIKLEPKISAAAGDPKKPMPRSLGITLSWEATIAVFVLLLSSSLIITTPPRIEEKNFKLVTNGNGAIVTLTEHPFEDNTLLLTFSDQDSASAITSVTVAATNEDKQIGPLPVSLEERFPGGFAFSEDKFSIPGRWKLDIDAKRESGYDAVGAFSFIYPDDIVASRVPYEKRTFDFFTIASIVGALGIIGLASFLWKRASTNYRLALERLGSFSSQTKETIYLWEPGAWAFAILVGFTAWHFGFIGSHTGHAPIVSSFERECVANNHFWQEASPMRNGEATASFAILGCTVGDGSGTFHFGDQREYEFFIRPVHASAELHYDKRNVRVGVPAPFTIQIVGEDGKPITDIRPEHDRILHIMVVSKDFSVFQHIHIEDNGPVTDDMRSQARFPFRITFPKAGTYLVAVDYAVRGSVFLDTFPVAVGNPKQEAAPISDARTGVFNGYTVNMNLSSLHPRQKLQTTLSFDISKDGIPVTNLEPYLGAAAHMALVRDDFASFIHFHAFPKPTLWDQLTGAAGHAAHVTPPSSFGPTLIAPVTVPLAGNYRVFVEFEHEGKRIVASFPLTIAP